MEGSGVAAITGQMLTIGGHRIEKITTAAQRNAGRSSLIGGPVPITLE
jgi:hypothetical protein